MSVELILPAQLSQVSPARHAVQHLADPLGLADAAAAVTSELMTQAIHHSPPGGQIRVAASIDDGLLRIEVHDTGVGTTLGDPTDVGRGHAMVSALSYRVGSEQSHDGRSTWAELRIIRKAP